MTFSRLQYYFFLLAVFLLPFIIYKVGWLIISKPAVGKVLYINETSGRRSGRQTFPVVEFITPKHVVTVRGNYNLRYKEGDNYPIRYNPFKETDTRLNTFFGCWIDTMIWCLIFAVGVSLTFIADGIVPRGKLVNISAKGVKFIGCS
jgi:hypothetical protein